MEENERQAARERVKEKGIKSAVEQPKKPRLDQPPPSNLDADDPVDDDDDDDDDERCYVFTCHWPSCLVEQTMNIFLTLKITQDFEKRISNNIVLSIITCRDSLVHVVGHLRKYFQIVYKFASFS